MLERPPVRFLGVWDVVAAFGIPINLGFNFNRINLGYKLGLSKGVKYCYHALALDEARQAFRPTRVKGGCEVWFRGVHSDVGGGNDNHALNDITLRWMLRKAIASGLPMAADCIGTSCTRINIDGKISDNFDPIRNRAREPKADDRFHYTVARALRARESARSLHARNRAPRRPGVEGRVSEAEAERPASKGGDSQRLRRFSAEGARGAQTTLRQGGSRRSVRLGAGDLGRWHPLRLFRVSA